MGRCVAFIALMAASLPVWLAGQSSPPPSQDPPVFRSGVEAVRLDAFVTDKKGNAVAGLTADDFEIFEDGRWQQVQLFAPVELPLPVVGRRDPVLRDIAINDEHQERIYVIVFDWLSWATAVRATKIVQRFLDHYFGDSDLAALVTLDQSGSMHFTNDRARLMAQANAFVERFADYSTRVMPGERPARSAFDRLAFPTRNGFERASAFGEIAEALGHIEARRKSILYIGAGPGFDPYDAIDMPKSSFTEEARAAMEPIMASNLTVYPIFPGVAGPMDLGGMRALARVTGATPIGSDIDRAFRQIVRDNSIYYVLGYDSTNRVRDGGYRRIKVRMKRKDLKVRARDGYFVEFPPDEPLPAGRLERPHAAAAPSLTAIRTAARARPGDCQPRGVDGRSDESVRGAAQNRRGRGCRLDRDRASAFRSRPHRSEWTPGRQHRRGGRRDDGANYTAAEHAVHLRRPHGRRGAGTGASPWIAAGGGSHAESR